MEKKNYSLLYFLGVIFGCCIVIYFIYIIFFALRGNISIKILDYTTTRVGGLTDKQTGFFDQMTVHFTITNDTNKDTTFATKNIGVLSLGKVYYPDILIDNHNNIVKSFSISSHTSRSLTATFLQYPDATNAVFEVSNNLTTDIFTSNIAAKPTLQPLVKK